MARVARQSDGGGAQRSIQSIEVGFRLIHVLETARAPLPLKTLAAGADMTPAKAHLYLVSFIRLGLVVQEQSTQHYRLGPYALQLGQAALRQLDLPALAHGPLEKLQKTFELPTYLSIWGAGGPFSVLTFDADLPTPVTIRTGFVFPLLGTATGRIFLTYLPDATTRALAERESALYPDLAGRREAMIDEARTTGVSISEGYLFRGFCAISAPVFNHSGELVAAVTMIGVATLMDQGAEGAMASAVRSAGATISAALGYKPS
ncbi:MAG: IclR family transcriptional regulator [Hyphomicrobiales bacterium]|nr:IclR family transcriptional regulator [Hyphomicrobiales bacterium]